MAWFRNHYRCERCDGEWTDEWSCMCDDDCPACGLRHMSPYSSDDLTKVVERRAHLFVVLQSPESAEWTPDYEEVASFLTLELAEVFMHAKMPAQ
jgi:hypothetical protein